ncbi:unnamed protein product [Bursaphelenchus okinawaensis]|uniref:Uncharacterized protein n=1 Tax=Bursaphelenchus okinawaensis TaxID=465554 RepID=A0A811K9H8_9BILA|nr:unnamed protein product [Bursaphelenchus okinawaensis]CAG9095151.1 unnamed protein product [Bursaphelenchus okinawaensis]
MSLLSVLAGISASVGASSLKFLFNEDLNLIFNVVLLSTFVVSNVLVWWLQLKSMSSNSTVNSILAFAGSNFITAVS